MAVTASEGRRRTTCGTCGDRPCHQAGALVMPAFAVRAAIERESGDKLQRGWGKPAEAETSIRSGRHDAASLPSLSGD